MKKFLLFAISFISFYANAQLTVSEDGKVHIGDYTSTSIGDIITLSNTNNVSSGGILDISSKCKTHNSSLNCAEGSITFGSNNLMIYGCGRDGMLNLKGKNGLSIDIDNKTSIFSIYGLTKKVYSSYEIKAPSFVTGSVLTSSDARLKKNVESLSGSFKQLADVNAVSYNLNSYSISGSGVATANKTEVAEDIEDDRLHFGFIAQEIQKIYPNLVVEEEDGMLAIDYLGFIPLLVEAYKDMANKVKEQEEMINALVTKKNPSYMPASVNGIEEQKAVLKQNKPNPFSVITSIECYVPQSVAAAFICIYDLQGKQIHRLDISERGSVVNTVDASRLAPGMYIYSLITDGVEIDSKRMIITD